MIKLVVGGEGLVVVRRVLGHEDGALGGVLQQPRELFLIFLHGVRMASSNGTRLIRLGLLRLGQPRVKLLRLRVRHCFCVGLVRKDCRLLAYQIDYV